jgi:NADPH-dependent ferric siderophore reductase
MIENFGYEPKTHMAGVCEVVCTVMITPHMRRITLHGSALTGLERYWRPEMLIRLYFPPKGHNNPPVPFLTSEGELEFKTTKESEVSPFSAFSEDPLVRAFTARRYRPETLELDIDFALHDVSGLAGDWAKGAKIGDRLGVVEFALPAGHRPATAHEADVYLLFADEAAIPSAQTNLEAFTSGTKVIAFFEVANKLEEQTIETKADLTVIWLYNENANPDHNLFLKALQAFDWPAGNVFAWACGEMKKVTEMHRFFIDKGLKRGNFKCQAYWRKEKTEVQRMARMTELGMAAVENDPDAFQTVFEEIGMNIEDPSLFGDPELVEAVTEEVAETSLSQSLTTYDKWSISMKTPFGKQKATLYISIDSNSFTGKMEAKNGIGGITDGVINGNKWTWTTTVKMPRSMTIEFSAEVDESSMSGKAKITKLGAFGNVPFTGERI